MRHRITYLRQPKAGEDFDPRESLKVWEKSMRISDLDAAKEHKITLSLEELPQELSSTLGTLSSFHLRWTSPKPYRAISPLVARTSPGLYVEYAANSLNTTNDGNGMICPILKTVFGEVHKCDDQSSTTSTHLPETYVYHTLLPTLKDLTNYLTTHVCISSKCNTAAKSLLSASYLEIDYTATSPVSITAYWHESATGGKWNEIIDYHEHERCEVGLLSEERRLEDAEIGDVRMGGWLTVVGGDKKPKATLFSFPSRHHAHPPQPHSLTSPPPKFTATFSHPTGLHPTLLLTLPSTLLAPPHIANTSLCTLYTHLTLPSALFIDRHAYSDALFLRSHNLLALASIAGATDLEAPEWSTRAWGSSALFSIDTSTSTSNTTKDSSGKDMNTDMSVTIPLHLRYLSPAKGGYTDVTMGVPSVFWACSAAAVSSEEGRVEFKPRGNPFDRVDLPYSGLFDEKTMMYHIEPSVTVQGGKQGMLTLDVKVPVLDLRQAWYVEPVTAAVVALGVLWILWKCFGPLGGDGGRKAEGSRVDEGEKGGRAVDKEVVAAEKKEM